VQDLLAIRFVPGTKASHDYDGKEVKTFSYRDLWHRNLPAVGIPARQNNLVIIDVDVPGTSHKVDGRPFWTQFCAEFGIPQTYTVQSPSGGYHFYFRLPESVNPDTFSPPDELAQGVDVKWNGWVGAPPTPGYVNVHGGLGDIQVVPPALMMEMARLKQGQLIRTFDATDPNVKLDLHRPFTEQQIFELRQRIEWIQQNATLSRAEWRDGLFALKAGIEDPVLLDELVCRWTMNKSYVQGDEDQARSIAAKADRHGPIGPGSIFKIINDVYIRNSAPVPDSPFTIQEILDRSRVQKKIKQDGTLVIETSESNVAALLGAIFDEKTLYHDVRSDLFIYKGRSYSDAELVSMFLPMLQSPAFGLGLEKFRRATVAAGLDVLMATRRRDPHQEYLKELRWDGINRIETFFSKYVGAEDTAYTRKVGVNFWTALAARGLRPGCKFDSMVILEGHEGIHKSSLVEAIGGQYTYAPSKKDSIDNLDVLRQMHQAVIVELPELIGLINQPAEYVKAFLSKPFDNIRALYARKAMRNERGFVLLGTTNSDRYLPTAMGARRFWPIKIPLGARINLSAIKADRDQLFAEAIAMFNEGHEYWHMPKELLTPVIDEKVMEEPLIGPIREIISSFNNPWTTVEVYRRLEGGGFVNRGYQGSTVSRIEDCFLRLGCERVNGFEWQLKDDSLKKTVMFNSAIQSLIQAGLTPGLQSYI
jgi:hypothetical protein